MRKLVLFHLCFLIQAGLLLRAGSSHAAGDTGFSMANELAQLKSRTNIRRFKFDGLPEGGVRFGGRPTQKGEHQIYRIDHFKPIQVGSKKFPVFLYQDSFLNRDANFIIQLELSAQDGIAGGNVITATVTKFLLSEIKTDEPPAPSGYRAYVEGPQELADRGYDVVMVANLEVGLSFPVYGKQESKQDFNLVCRKYRGTVLGIETSKRWFECQSNSGPNAWLQFEY